jgi:hypothetical protein
VQVHVDGLDGPGEPLPALFHIPGLAAVQRVADAAELRGRFLGQLGEVAFGDGRCLVAAQAAEDLDAEPVVGPASGGVRQDDAARVGGEQPRVGQGDETAEAAAEHDRSGQPERVAQPPQVIGPGPQVPEPGGAVVAAAVPALVVEEDLKAFRERRQPRLHVDVVQAGPP